eukprot:scaffold32655_cov51-Isochrysis_galbana.AAC.1
MESSSPAIHGILHTLRTTFSRHFPGKAHVSSSIQKKDSPRDPPPAPCACTPSRLLNRHLLEPCAGPREGFYYPVVRSVQRASGHRLSL